MVLVEPVEQDAVEAAVALGLAGEVMPGRQNDAPLLAGGDAGTGAAEIAAAAQADFDKDQCRTVAADQVDFAAANPEIAFENA